MAYSDEAKCAAERLDVPTREKYWEEMSADEKIEKLGRVVEEQERVIHNLFERLERVPEHAHIDGKVFVSAERMYNQIAVNPVGYRHSVIGREPLDFKLGRLR